MKKLLLLTILIMVSFFFISTSKAEAAISFDAATLGSNTTSSPATFAHTVSAGSNKMLFVAIDIYKDSLPDSDPISGITYNDVAMTLVAYTSYGSGNPRAVALWALPIVFSDGNSHDVVITWTTTERSITPRAISYNDVKQEQPEAYSTASTINSADISISVTTITPNAWVIGTLAAANYGTPSAGANTVLRDSNSPPSIWESSNNPIGTPGSVTLNITGTGSTANDWTNVMVAVSIAPHVAPPGPIRTIKGIGISR